MCDRDVITNNRQRWIGAACAWVAAAMVVISAGCAETQTPAWLRGGANRSMNSSQADASATESSRVDPAAAGPSDAVHSSAASRNGAKSTTTIGDENGKPKAQTVRNDSAEATAAVKSKPGYRQTSNRPAVDGTVPKDRDAYITQMLSRIRKDEAKGNASASATSDADASSLATKLGKKPEPATLNEEPEEATVEEAAEGDRSLAIEARLPASAKSGRSRALGQASAEAAEGSSLQEKRAAAEAELGEEPTAASVKPSKYDAMVGKNEAATKTRGEASVSDAAAASGQNAAKVTPTAKSDVANAVPTKDVASGAANASVASGSVRAESTKAPSAAVTTPAKTNDVPDSGVQITKIRSVDLPTANSVEPAAPAKAAEPVKAATPAKAAQPAAVVKAANVEGDATTIENRKIAEKATAKEVHPTRVETLDVGPISAETTAQSANNAMELEDAATASAKTRGDLKAMISKLEDRLAVHPEDVSTQLKLKMLHAAQGQWDQAVQNAAETKAAGDTFTANAFADVVAKTLQVYDDTTLSSAEQANRALQLVERMQSMLKQQADLRINELRLCRSVSNFGTYEEMAKTYFVAGKPRPVVVYVEIDNFTSKQDEATGHYQTLLSMTVELVSVNGKVLDRKQYPKIEDMSNRKRRDFYIAPKPVTLPAMAAGKYTVKVTVEDLLGNKVAQKGTTIEVK